MTRPKLEDFPYNRSVFNEIMYKDALEKYCDALEKALDKTCNKLEDFTAHMYDEGVCFTPCIMQSEHWKEWALEENKKE